MSSPGRDATTDLLETEVQHLSVKDEQTAKSDTSKSSRPDLSRQGSVIIKSKSGSSTPHISSSSSSARISRSKPATSGAPSDVEDHVKSPLPPKITDDAVPILGVKPEVIPANGTPKNGKPSKPSKKSKSTPARTQVLYSHLEDKTEEATSVFQVITGSIYSAKYLGVTEHALECDCTEERDQDGVNMACGEDSDCINRATKMECSNDCECGAACQNQRFQRRQYADVSVIKTDKKGYGLRINVDILPNQFIFEYIGEVINEPNFRKRMMTYDQEGIKHFYFMSLSKGEFVDATRKGNLGRFCNHSCNPNCYVDKWVVDDKLRMGIFAERHIKAGEELVFNYNVDRYGADPQPCYCGEVNCEGFIGGKTQTDSGTKLSVTMIEALGIDGDDAWNIIPKKPKKRKTEERDDDYDLGDVKIKTMAENDVTKVMATLMQCKEKWVVVKLLARLQDSQDDKVFNRVAKMHGYQILKSILSTWIQDDNVVLQTLDVLFNLPRITRNKIQDSKIEDAVQKAIDTSTDERVITRATELLEAWSKLEVGYRIPLLRRDSTSHIAAQSPKPVSTYSDRRGQNSQPERRRSPPPSTIPTGPRAARAGPPPQPRSRQSKLPTGWFPAFANGQVYYYSASGQTTWEVPTKPAAAPAYVPPSQRPLTEAERLDAIIQGIVQNTKTAATGVGSSSIGTPTEKQGVIKTGTFYKDGLKVKEPKKEKWRGWDVEKQMRLYENTLFPTIRHVMNKYKERLPREDLKRFGKEISKKLVASDYKNNRVSDPTKITEKQEHQIRKFVKVFLDKAVVKRKEYQTKKSAKGNPEDGSTVTSPQEVTIDESSNSGRNAGGEDDDAEHQDMPNVISDDEEDETTGDTPVTSWTASEVPSIANSHSPEFRKRKLNVSEADDRDTSVSMRSVTPLKKARRRDDHQFQEPDGGEISNPSVMLSSSSSAPTPPPPPPQKESSGPDGDDGDGLDRSEVQKEVQAGVSQSDGIQI